MSEGQIQIITSFKPVRPPTLKQFVAQKLFAEAAKQGKGLDGTVSDGARILPRTAKRMHEVLPKIDVEKALKERPEIEADYKVKYGQHR